MSSSEDSPPRRNGHRDVDDLRDTIESSEHSVNGAGQSDDEGGDLFGSDEEDPRGQPLRQRKLDDEELDSGDDEGRRDRENPIDEDEEEDVDYGTQQSRIVTYDAHLQRMQDPDITDNDLYLVNLPPFLGIETENFDPSAYIPPIQGHAGPTPPNVKFSPFTAASTSLFWRHDPATAEKIQSSARIVRWSDGSLTLQLASSPKDQYKISATALRQVPPNPRKPLPISNHKSANVSREYDPNRDAHVYLAAAHASDSMYRIVSPVTASLKILPTGEQNDDAMLRLQSSLAAAVSTDDPVSSVREVKEDPELAKKRAELAEKEKMRAQRRRENQEQKDLDKRKRVFGRSSRAGGTGLTIGDLEGDDDMRPSRPRKKPKRRPNRRGEIYTDDEEEGDARGRTKEDEYDEDDGFLVGSDEEPEVMEASEPEEDEDPDVDDLEIEGRQTVFAERSRAGAPQDKAATPPRRSAMDLEDEEARNSPQQRKRGKRVVDDDDDE